MAQWSFSTNSFMEQLERKTAVEIFCGKYRVCFLAVEHMLKVVPELEKKLVYFQMAWPLTDATRMFVETSFPIKVNEEGLALCVDKSIKKKL